MILITDVVEMQDVGNDRGRVIFQLCAEQKAPRRSMQSHSSQALLLVLLSAMNPGKQVSYFTASTGALKQAWNFYCQS